MHVGCPYVYLFPQAQKAALQTRFDSPPRPRHMPHEIHLFHQKNASPISQVSGATGLDDRILLPAKVQEMLKPALPSMGSSESESLHSNRILHRSSSGSSHRSLDNVDPKRILFAPIQDDWNTRSDRKQYGALHDVETMQQGSNLMVRSARFERLVQYVFDVVDVDKSGKICKKELYAGLILVHLKLAAYIGSAACRPASREYVEEIFDKLDVDKNGFLSRKEFRVAMMMFCSQVVSRVILQICMTLVIVPFLAKYVLDIWNDVMTLAQIVLAGVKDAELMSNRFWVFLCSVLNCIVPAGIKSICLNCTSKLFEVIPAGAWDALPLTIISCALSASLIPWMLFQVDELYNRLAVGRTERTKKQR
jgi:Ca2+-binding protein (EF-Hand superfamily)